MSTANKILLFALLVAALVAGFLFYSAGADKPPSRGASAETRMRPEFSLPDIDGTLQNVSAWDGKALIVNFWATWCKPCRREIPLLNEMHDELAARDIQILGIAIDDPAAVRDFAGQVEISYPVLVGEQQAIEVAEAFGAEVIALPLTVFTDHSGKVIDMHAGEIERPDLEAAIKRLDR